MDEEKTNKLLEDVASIKKTTEDLSIKKRNCDTNEGKP